MILLHLARAITESFHQRQTSNSVSCRELSMPQPRPIMLLLFSQAINISIYIHVYILFWKRAAVVFAILDCVYLHQREHWLQRDHSR
jgi:hypothetical protein